MNAGPVRVANPASPAAGRLSVEAWAPEYGSPMESAGGQDGATDVDLDVEYDAASWAPVRPPVADEFPVAFTDGVRRVDANVVWNGPGGTMEVGLAASVAAGVVRCDGRAEITSVAVERVLLLGPGVGLSGAVHTRHGSWRHRSGSAGDPSRLAIDLQQVMADLEVHVASHAERVGLVIVDGPIRRREDIPNAVGHIKTHHQQYLPPSLLPVVAALDPGERTPLFAVGGPFGTLSWYTRLPCERQHPWSGVVRHEIAIAEPGEARRLADLATATVGRFASRPARDPRAPQNLTPVSGLEATLRHRLGDATVLYRALRAALA